jgi:hypothetical protein
MLRMAHKEEMNCRFALKETTTSQYALLCEPVDKNLSVLADGRLMLKLKPGISFGYAEQIAKFLQENVTAVVYVQS